MRYNCLTMTDSSVNPTWYAAGLAFECQQCGRCCSGPEEGYVWVTEVEIAQIAALLGITPERFRNHHCRRVSGRYTILEHRHSRNCTFLEPCHGGLGCSIYSVRPSQCRTWPFWQHNLDAPDDWARAGQRCRGINRGKLFTLEEIEGRLRRTSE